MLKYTMQTSRSFHKNQDTMALYRYVAMANLDYSRMFYNKHE